MKVHKGWEIYSEVHSPITTPEIICVVALTLQPIRGCPQHSGETVTRLLSAIHRRLLSLFFLRKGRRLYTGYLKSGVTPWDVPSLHLSLTNKPPIRVLFFGLPLRAIPNHKMCHNYVKKKRPNGRQISQKGLRVSYPRSMELIFAWRGEVISGHLANRFGS